MGSIYGNRNRQNNSNTANSNQKVRDERDSHSNRSRGKTAFRKNEVEQKKQLGNILEDVRIKRIIFSSIVNLIVVAIFIILSYVLIDGDYRDVYTKLLLLPMASFCGNFIMRFLCKDFLLNFIGSLIILAIAFLIFVDVSWTILLWLLFYFANGVLGALIASVAKKSSKNRTDY